MTILPNDPNRSLLLRQRENEKRIALERSMVRGLIRAMKAEGYKVAAVFDSEEYVYAAAETALGAETREDSGAVRHTMNEREALDAVFSVDTCTLHFTHRNALTWGNRGVFIVLGNGADCLSDWHSPDKDKEPFGEIPFRMADKADAASR